MHRGALVCPTNACQQRPPGGNDRCPCSWGSRPKNWPQGQELDGKLGTCHKANAHGWPGHPRATATAESPPRPAQIEAGVPSGSPAGPARRPAAWRPDRNTLRGAASAPQTETRPAQSPAISRPAGDFRQRRGGSPLWQVAGEAQAPGGPGPGGKGPGRPRAAAVPAPLTGGGASWSPAPSPEEGLPGALPPHWGSGFLESRPRPRGAASWSPAPHWGRGFVKSRLQHGVRLPGVPPQRSCRPGWRLQLGTANGNDQSYKRR